MSIKSSNFAYFVQNPIDIQFIVLLWFARFV